MCVPGPYHDPVQRPSIVAHAAEGELLTRELTSKTFGRLLIGAVKRGEEHCRGRVSNIDRNGGEIRHVPWIPRFANNFVIHEFSRASISLNERDRSKERESKQMQFFSRNFINHWPPSALRRVRSSSHHGGCIVKIILGGVLGKRRR